MAERNRYGTAESRILAWLERADFTGQGCWHSQDTIARATGCCKRTVIRAVANLEADDKLSVQRSPRGSRRCNVYRVRHWNPHKRAGVLNVLGAISEARKAECHSNRTAALSRARDAVASTAEVDGKDHRFLSASSWKDQRCGRESARNRFGGSSMDQPRRRHLHQVADLHCPHCGPTHEENERLKTVLRKYAESETKRAEEVSGAYDTIRAQGKEITRLRRDLTVQAKESARAEQIEKVVEHWRSHRPKASSAFGKPGSKSYQVIEKALALMADDQAGPVLACCEAIDGLHLAPWQRFDQRFTKPGEGRILRNGVEHALGDEGRIERCRGILRKVREGGARRAFELLRAVQATEYALEDEFLDLLGEKRCRREEVVEVEGIVTRVDER